MATRTRYKSRWIDDDDVECEFDITIESEPDSYWEPGYSSVVEETYEIDFEEVTRDVFVERTGWDIEDMEHERYKTY